MTAAARKLDLVRLATVRRALRSAVSKLSAAELEVLRLRNARRRAA